MIFVIKEECELFYMPYEAVLVYKQIDMCNFDQHEMYALRNERGTL